MYHVVINLNKDVNSNVKNEVRFQVRFMIQFGESDRFLHIVLVPHTTIFFFIVKCCYDATFVKHTEREKWCSTLKILLDKYDFGLL